MYHLVVARHCNFITLIHWLIIYIDNNLFSYLLSFGYNFRSDNSNWDDEYLFDDDDYFLNELSLPNSSQENMENEDGDGGYDDDTDVDDDVLILEPGHENEHNEGEGDNQEEDDDQDTDDEEDEDEREDGAARAGPPPRKVAKLGKYI